MAYGTSAAATERDAYESFVATLSERDKRNVRRHVDACETEPTTDHAVLWKRLACTLAALSKRSVKTTGMRAVQFFAPDGAYQVQLFALEDPRDGTLAVYTPDTLAAATAAGVIAGPIPTVGEALLYEVGGVPGLNIEVEVLTAAKVVDAPDYYRHLLGWNRRAVRITLRTTAGHAQISACESVCRLAAHQTAAARTAHLARAATQHE